MISFDPASRQVAPAAARTNATPSHGNDDDTFAEWLDRSSSTEHEPVAPRAQADRPSIRQASVEDHDLDRPAGRRDDEMDPRDRPIAPRPQRRQRSLTRQVEHSPVQRTEAPAAATARPNFAKVAARSAAAATAAADADAAATTASTTAAGTGTAALLAARAAASSPAAGTSAAASTATASTSAAGTGVDASASGNATAVSAVTTGAAATGAAATDIAGTATDGIVSDVQSSSTAAGVRPSTAPPLPGAADGATLPGATASTEVAAGLTGAGAAAGAAGATAGASASAAGTSPSAPAGVATASDGANGQQAVAAAVPGASTPVDPSAAAAVVASTGGVVVDGVQPTSVATGSAGRTRAGGTDETVDAAAPTHGAAVTQPAGATPTSTSTSTGTAATTLPAATNATTPNPTHTSSAATSTATTATAGTSATAAAGGSVAAASAGGTAGAQPGGAAVANGGTAAATNPTATATPTPATAAHAGGVAQRTFDVVAASAEASTAPAMAAAGATAIAAESAGAGSAPSKHVATESGDVSLTGLAAGGVVPHDRPATAASSARPEAPAAPTPQPDAAKPMPSKAGLGGPMHLDVDLTSEGLGPLQLRASTVDGQLHVSLASGDAHVRATLAAHAPELRREMEAAGLNPSSLDVGGSSGGEHGGHASAGQQAADGRGGSGMTARDRYASATPTTSTPATAPAPRPTSSRLDLKL